MLKTNRKPVPPATGVARWVGTDPVTDNPLLRITTDRVSQDYELETVPGGFRLWRLDPATFTLVCYSLKTGREWTCDCPDSTQRPERKHCCKHVRATRAALDALPF